MASRKNRSGKANRRSPKAPASLFERFQTRLNAAVTWLGSRRLLAIVAAVIVLFAGSLVGGYWLAQKLDSRDGDRIVRDTLEDMRRGAQSGAVPETRYARIEDLPEFPKYSEAEPGKPRATLEERARPAKPQQVAAAATAEQAWRRYAVPFRDLNSKPLVAIVIDDVGLDRLRSKRAWELPGPMTMAFLPYAKDLGEQARAARARGHELMLHLPMQPNGS
ncbi:MAG: hypothetical protein EPO67_15525, partial [Reyranella sp.]